MHGDASSCSSKRTWSRTGRDLPSKCRTSTASLAVADTLNRNVGRGLGHFSYSRCVEWANSSRALGTGPLGPSRPLTGVCAGLSSSKTRVAFTRPIWAVRIGRGRSMADRTHGHRHSPSSLRLVATSLSTPGVAPGGGDGFHPRVRPWADAKEPFEADTDAMTLPEYLLNLFLVALVVLQVRGHKVTKARLVLPLVVTIWVCISILRGIPTAGNDLVLVVGGTAFGATLEPWPHWPRRFAATARAPLPRPAPSPPSCGWRASEPGSASRCGSPTAAHRPSPGSAQPTTSPLEQPGPRPSSSWQWPRWRPGPPAST